MGQEHAPKSAIEVQDGVSDEEWGVVYDLATKARIESTPIKARSYARSSTTTERAFERFLELPVLIVLIVIWVVGAGLMACGALVLYLVGSELLRLVAEAI